MKYISVLMQFVLLYVAVSGPAYACNQPPGYGFIIYSYLQDNTRIFVTFTNQVGQSLHGEWLRDNGSAAGNSGPFDGITDARGLLEELGARSPARWRIKDVNGYCSAQDFAHPPSLPDYEDLDLGASSTPQNHVCIRYPVALAWGVFSDSWVHVSYSHGSVADIPTGGGSPPDVPPTTSDWGTSQLYDNNGAFLENISSTNVTANSADYDTWPYGQPGSECIFLHLVIFDTSGNSCARIVFTVPNGC